MENRPPTPPEFEPRFSNTPWETRVALMANAQLRSMLKNRLHGDPLPDVNLSMGNSYEYQTLQKMYELDKRTLRNYMTENPTTQDRPLVYQRSSFYKNLADEIRDKRRYYLFNNLLNIVPITDLREIGDTVSELPEIVTRVLSTDLATLHLMVSRPDRLLVGTKDGVYWKKINWPKEQLGAWMGTSRFYLSTLPLIGKRELITVPDHPLSLEDVADIKIPSTLASADELLERAYYEQRYIVPTDGAEVRFRKAGDLDKMIVLQSGDKILAKAVTPRGETFASIDINTGEMIYHGSLPLSIILAGVYHDLVTAVELPRNRFKRLKGFKTQQTGQEDDNPQFTYIPRIIRVGEEERRHYDGPPRPVSPHRVRGHRRAGNLTEKHRGKLLEFEQKYKVKILEFLPAGFTFVRPHFVPSDANLEGLPVFIKRRRQSKIQEDLQRPT